MSAHAVLHLLGRITAILVAVAAVGAVAVLVVFALWMENLGLDYDERERMMIRYRADDLTIEFARLKDANRPETEYTRAVEAQFGVVVGFRQGANQLDIDIQLANSPSDDFSPGEIRQCYRFTVVHGDTPGATYTPIACSSVPEETG